MTQTERLELNRKMSMHLDTINTSPLGTVVTFLYTESLLKAVLAITALEPERASCILEHTPEHIRKPIIAALTRSIRMLPDVYEKRITDAAETIQHIQLNEKHQVYTAFMAEFEDSMQLIQADIAKK